MIGRTVVALAASAAIGIGAAGCVTFVEVPIQVPFQAKIDVTAFQRVLVAGFLTSGSKAVDPNTETARLLRSQLRTKSDLKVIDTDVLSLVDEVNKQRNAAAGANFVASPLDLVPYETIFQDEAFWKKLGQEYQGPLIITGSMNFSETTKAGDVSTLEKYVDEKTGETKYREVRSTSNLKGYALDVKFVFIDGRTGKILHTESIKDETLYQQTANTPALSSYFDLMDRILPTFLNTLSNQKVPGTRILIK